MLFNGVWILKELRRTSVSLLHCLKIAITPRDPFPQDCWGPRDGVFNVHVEWNVSGSTSLALSQSKQEIGHLCPIVNAYDSLSSVTGAE